MLWGQVLSKRWSSILIVASGSVTYLLITLSNSLETSWGGATLSAQILKCCRLCCMIGFTPCLNKDIMLHAKGAWNRKPLLVATFPIVFQRPAGSAITLAELQANSKTATGNVSDSLPVGDHTAAKPDTRPVTPQHQRDIQKGTNRLILFVNLHWSRLSQPPHLEVKGHG